MIRVLAIAAAAAALIAELYVLALYAPARVESRGRHHAPIDEFSRGVLVRQVFVTPDDALDRIDVLMHATRATDAMVSWTLERVREAGVVEVAAAGRRKLSLPEGDSWQVFVVSPDVGTAAGRHAFSLKLDPASVNAESSVTVANVLDNPLGDGYVAVNGVPRWGDLALRAHARAETVAGRFMVKVAPGLPRPFNYGVVWLGLLAALNVLAALTVREILLAA